MPTHNPIKINSQNTQNDIVYTLDANHNRLGRYDNGIITSYEYQPHTDRLIHVKRPDYTVSYEYNPVGSLAKIVKFNKKDNTTSVQTISYICLTIKAIYQNDV